MLLPLAACMLLHADPRPITFAADDWPWWRGPTRDGIAEPRQSPPLEWSAEKNVLWKAAVPGRGHGSPCVAGKFIYLATADEKEQTQSVVCFRRDDGKLEWETVVHKGNFVKGGNAKKSDASCTVCCDGERLFVNFPNDGAIHATALGLDGKKLWQTKVSDYVLHQGFGSSPAVFGPLVLVTADTKAGGAVAGLSRATGEVAWKNARPKLPNYASPIILKAGGRERLFLTGTDLITALDPLTGKKHWEVSGSTEECVTSTVTDGERIFTSGGYPKNHVAAVDAATGKEVWKNATRVYVPSMLCHRGHLYAVQDAGVAICWDSASGKERWRGRLAGTFSSSPVLVGDTIFATNEAGLTFLFKASPDRFELAGKNQLGDQVYATPSICGGRIHMRVATSEKGRRQEWLFCIGKKG